MYIKDTKISPLYNGELNAYANLSINRRETCTLFFEEDLLQKILQTSS